MFLTDPFYCDQILLLYVESIQSFTPEEYQEFLLHFYNLTGMYLKYKLNNYYYHHFNAISKKKA